MKLNLSMNESVIIAGILMTDVGGEVLLEFDTSINNEFKVNFYGYPNNVIPPHGPRLKFKNFDDDISIAINKYDYHVECDNPPSHYPRSNSGKANTRAAIEVALMLSEFLGREFVNYYYDNSVYNEILLKTRIKEFNRLSKTEKRAYYLKGRSRMEGKIPV